MLTRRRQNGGRENAELAALADGSLTAERRAALEARVADSPELADRLAEQENALALLRGAAAEIETPARLRARVEAQRRVRRPLPARRLALAGAAAAAALAVGISLALIGGGEGPVFRAALAPTDVAPAASGEATFQKTPSGWQIELHAHGLAHLAGGRFYEAWLRNTAGVLVPVGTFNDGRTVILWAGVSPKEFTSLTITRERADGNQASSGEKVLVGTARAWR